MHNVVILQKTIIVRTTYSGRKKERPKKQKPPEKAGKESDGISQQIIIWAVDGLY